MGESLLPDRADAQSLIDEYLTCDNATIDLMTEEYGYKNRSNFTDAMRRTYGVNRVRVGRTTPKQYTVDSDIFKNKFLKQDGIYYILDLGPDKKKVLVINDIHVPFQDKITWNLILRVIKDNKPDIIVINGDLIDFSQISKFVIDPKLRGTLEDDINDTRLLLGEIREAAPHAKIIFIAGNHEDRLRQYLWSRAPELSKMPDFDIPRQFRLDIFKIDYVPYNSTLILNDVFKVEHGDCVSKHSGWTAKAMFEKRGGNGMVGHCHRKGDHQKTINGDTNGWWENGCLCDMNPSYTKEPNWQQAFAMITFIGKWFSVYPVPIIKHKFIFDGKLYE